MKRIKKLFTLLLILPLISLCLVGCRNKETTIALTKENIRDYMVVNYTFEIAYSDSAMNNCIIFTIETTKRQKNLIFENCEFKFSIIEDNSHVSNASEKYKILSEPKLIQVDYSGVSKFSCYTYFQTNQLKEFDKNLIFEFTEVSGSVIINS